jgi:hypothetical protein
VVEGGGLVGPYASCNHEVGNEGGVVGAHGVGEKADMGGDGHQTCIAEVTCVVWWWVVPLSRGHSGVRIFLTGSWRTCVALLPSMRLLGSRSYGVSVSISMDEVGLVSARGRCSCVDFGSSQ